jgi:hypothetical protein
MSTLWAVSLPAQRSKTATFHPRTLFEAKITGPASSLAAGMTIASISNDLYYIEHLWTQHFANDDYRFTFSTAANRVASTAVIKILTASTGAAVSDATDLSAVSWYVLGIGSGKFSTLAD